MLSIGRAGLSNQTLVSENGQRVNHVHTNHTRLVHICISFIIGVCVLLSQKMVYLLHKLLIDQLSR